MMSCKAHGQIDPGIAVGCPECVDLLRNIAQAVHHEVTFTFSHPMAADRGEVWTDYQKAPKLYLAMKAYWKALKVTGQKVRKNTRKKKS